MMNKHEVDSNTKNALGKMGQVLLDLSTVTQRGNEALNSEGWS